MKTMQWLALGAFGAILAAPVAAQDYPSKPVTIISAQASDAIVGAIERTLGERTLRTRDLGGNADTTACGKAVAEMVE